MSRRIEYREYFVAFLDILGFKNLIAYKSAEDIHKIFANVRNVEKIVLGRRFKEFPITEIERNTFFLCFSDSIVCAIPCDIPNSFEALTSHCMLIQHSFWLEPTPIWIRGAIVRGELYCDNNEVFGPALVEAYKLEENLAKYPRIIMTNSTYENGLNNLDNHEDIPYVVDTADGLKMVEILKYFDYPEKENLRKHIELVLGEETDASVREKYLWIKEHYDYVD